MRRHQTKLPGIVTGNGRICGGFGRCPSPCRGERWRQVLYVGKLRGAQLSESVRFRATWEQTDSLRLHGNDSSVLAEYGQHGRILGGDPPRQPASRSLWTAPTSCGACRTRSGRRAAVANAVRGPTVTTARTPVMDAAAARMAGPTAEWPMRSDGAQLAGGAS